MNYHDYICCPKCKSDLEQVRNFLLCKKCDEKYEIVDEDIIKILPNITPDLELSISKWDEIYKGQLESESYNQDMFNYQKFFLPTVYSQLKETHLIGAKKVYLEIGCGPFFLGQILAPEVDLVIGVDFCPSALRIAKKMLIERGMRNYLLIQGDILNLPIRDNVADLIYGGGVIEHFKDTQPCISELYRVLKLDGISFNTVPYLNIGSLTYRQAWGNIPNVPVLKQIAEFVHIKVLKSRHMVFGYEMSFLGSTLKRIHTKAGFRHVEIKKFEIPLAFDFMPKLLRPYLIRLANSSRLFWPMIKVIAKK